MATLHKRVVSCGKLTYPEDKEKPYFFGIRWSEDVNKPLLIQAVSERDFFLRLEQIFRDTAITMLVEY